MKTHPTKYPLTKYATTASMSDGRLCIIKCSLISIFIIFICSLVPLPYHHQLHCNLEVNWTLLPYYTVCWVSCTSVRLSLHLLSVSINISEEGLRTALAPCALLYLAIHPYEAGEFSFRSQWNDSVCNLTNIIPTQTTTLSGNCWPHSPGFMVQLLAHNMDM